jgi:beta-lactamase superfamily II metal-dependent hydrolase
VESLNNVHSMNPLNDIFWLKVPHHGSRRNLSSELIAIMKPEYALISAKGDAKHPRRALVNCLKKAGVKVYSTHKSGSLWHSFGTFPPRRNYSSPAEQL